MSSEDNRIFGLCFEVDEDSPSNTLERIVSQKQFTPAYSPLCCSKSLSPGSVFNVQAYRAHVRIYGYTYRVLEIGPDRKVDVEAHPVVATGERIILDPETKKPFSEPCMLTVDFNHGVSLIDDAENFLGYGHSPEPPKWVLEEAARVIAISPPTSRNPAQSAFH